MRIPGSVKLLLPSAAATSVGVGEGVAVVDTPSADEEPRNVLPLLLPLSAQGRRRHTTAHLHLWRLHNTYGACKKVTLQCT